MYGRVNTIPKLYAFAFLDDFILIYPLYAVMFADSGLTAYQVSSLLAVWSLTSFLANIPAGILADRYSRRRLLLLGVLLRAAGYTIWLTDRTYWGFLAGFMLWGLKSALTHGTTEALVYGHLVELKEPSSYTRVRGVMRSLGLAAIVGASGGAALLVHHGYSAVLAVSIAAVLASALAVLLLPEIASDQTAEVGPWHQTLRAGLSLAAGHRTVRVALLALGIVSALGAVEEYLGLVLRQQGFSHSSIALWSGAIFLAGAVGSLLAHRIEGWRVSLTAALSLAVALLAMAAVSLQLLAPVLLAGFFMMLAVGEVLADASLQHGLTGKARATVTSLGSALGEMSTLAMFGIVGLTARGGNYTRGYLAVAVAVGAGVGMVAVAGRFQGVGAGRG